MKVKVQRKKSGSTMSYVITLPKKIIEGLGWQDVEIVEITIDIKDGRPVLRVTPVRE